MPKPMAPSPTKATLVEVIESIFLRSLDRKSLLNYCSNARSLHFFFVVYSRRPRSKQSPPSRALVQKDGPFHDWTSVTRVASGVIPECGVQPEL
jgi:hypothetical protein